MPLSITPESVEGMKVAELKEALEELGLSTEGLKKVLAARLLEAITSGAASSSEPAAAAEEDAPAAVEEAAPEPAPEPEAEPEPKRQKSEEAPPVVEEAAAPPPAEPVAEPPAAAAEEAEPAAAEPAAAESSGEAPPADAAADAPATAADDDAGRAQRMEAMRAEVGGLRKQHAELTGLVHQWYNSVMQLQQQQAAAAMAARGPPGGGYPGYPPQGAGGYPGAYPGYPGYPPAAPAPRPAQPAPAQWSEHYTAEGHKYWYNITTGQSSWTEPPRPQPSSGLPKAKGPPGANLFVVRKMRRGEFDEFYDHDLRQIFERFGTIVRAEITLDKDTGISKGFGFVSFDSVQAADAAIAEMNGAMIAGRQIRIEKTAEDH